MTTIWDPYRQSSHLYNLPNRQRRDEETNCVSKLLDGCTYSQEAGDFGALE